MTVGGQLPELDKGGGAILPPPLPTHTHTHTHTHTQYPIHFKAGF